MDKDSLSHMSRYCVCRVARAPRRRREVLCGETERKVGETPGMPAGQTGGAGMVEGSACPDHARVCLRIAPRRGAGDVVGRPGGRGATMPRERHHERGPLRAGTGRCGRRATTRAPSALASRPSRRHVRRQPDGSRTGWRECPRRGPDGSGHRPVAAMPLS